MFHFCKPKTANTPKKQIVNFAKENIALKMIYVKLKQNIIEVETHCKMEL